MKDGILKKVKLLKLIVIVLTIILFVVSFIIGILKAIDSSYEVITLFIGRIMFIIDVICWFAFTKLTSKQRPLRYKITILIFGLCIFCFVLAFY